MITAGAPDRAAGLFPEQSPIGKKACLGNGLTSISYLVGVLSFRQRKSLELRRMSDFFMIKRSQIKGYTADRYAPGDFSLGFKSRRKITKYG